MMRMAVFGKRVIGALVVLFLGQIFMPVPISGAGTYTHDVQLEGPITGDGRLTYTVNATLSGYGFGNALGFTGTGADTVELSGTVRINKSDPIFNPDYNPHRYLITLSSHRVSASMSDIYDQIDIVEQSYDGLPFDEDVIHNFSLSIPVSEEVKNFGHVAFNIYIERACSPTSFPHEYHGRIAWHPALGWGPVPGEPGEAEVRVSFIPDSLRLAPRVVEDDGRLSVEVTALIDPPNAPNKNVTWDSNHELVRVEPLGPDSAGNPRARVTAYVPNPRTVQAAVTATAVAGGHTAVLPVQIVYVPVKGIISIPGNLTLKTGNVGAIRYEVYPEDATDKRVRWVSSEPLAATIEGMPESFHGLVKGVSTGEAMITAITESGGFRVSCHVTVIEPDDTVTDDSINPDEFDFSAFDAAMDAADAASGLSPAPVAPPGTRVLPGNALLTNLLNNYPGGTMRHLNNIIQNIAARTINNLRNWIITNAASMLGPTAQLVNSFIHQVIAQGPATPSQTGSLSSYQWDQIERAGHLREYNRMKDQHKELQRIQSGTTCPDQKSDLGKQIAESDLALSKKGRVLSDRGIPFDPW